MWNKSFPGYVAMVRRGRLNQTVTQKPFVATIAWWALNLRFLAMAFKWCPTAPSPHSTTAHRFQAGRKKSCEAVFSFKWYGLIFTGLFYSFEPWSVFPGVVLPGQGFPACRAGWYFIRLPNPALLPHGWVSSICVSSWSALDVCSYSWSLTNLLLVPITAAAAFDDLETGDVAA